MYKKIPILFVLLTTLFIACQKPKLKRGYCDCANTPVTGNLTTNPCITIGDVFTPNGDGINDHFLMVNIELQDSVTIEIYKKGLTKKIVYSYSGTGQGAAMAPWDGTHNNVDVKDGKYHYELWVGEQYAKGLICIYRNNTPGYSFSDFDCLEDCSAVENGDPNLPY